MLIEKMKEYNYAINSRNLVNQNDMIGFIKEFMDASVENNERISVCSEACVVFWNMCLKMRVDTDSEEFVSSIIEFVRFTSVNLASNSDRQVQESDVFYLQKGSALVRFLFYLSSQNDSVDNLDFDFIDYYGKLCDVMDSIKWLFQLRVEDKLLFPIHVLLDRIIVNDFKPTEENFLQLIFSLQIFNKIDEFDQEDDIRKNILEISEKHHVKILSYLCDRGELLHGEYASVNSLKNQVLIAKRNNSILIRSQNSIYFDSMVGVCEETNNLGNVIANYIEFELLPNQELSSFVDVMRNGCNKTKRDMLIDVLKRGCFNCLMPQSVIINKDTGRYESLLNVYSHNDECIINSKDNYVENCWENFWNVLAKSQDGIRDAGLYVDSNNVNVLTLDFVIQFYRELVMEKTSSYLEMVANFKDDLFYQNQMIECYFERELERGEIVKAIELYYNFIKNHFNFKEVIESDPMTKFTKLIMPYAPFLPYSGNVDDLFNKMLLGEYFVSENIEEYRLETMVIKRGRSNKRLYHIGDVEIEKKCIESDEYDIDELKDETCKVFYSSELGKAIYLHEYKKLELLLKDIRSICCNAVIQECFIGKSSVKDITAIIKMIGVGQEVAHIYGINECEITADWIYLFKLLWHMQLYEFDEVRYSIFEKLIFDNFYTDYILHMEGDVNTFIERLVLLEDGKTLFIAKETAGEASTLALSVEKRYFDRGAIRWAFDANKLQKELIENDGKIYFKGSDEPIKKVIFLTDNIISGSSTNKMLKYHLKNIVNEGEIRSFLDLPDGKNVWQIVKKNAIDEIEIRCLFCFEEGKNKLKKIYEWDQVKVYAVNLIPEGRYTCTEDVKKIIEELYDEECQGLNQKCVLRPINMPADKILPKKVKDVEKISGIFRRKDEK